MTMREKIIVFRISYRAGYGLAMHFLTVPKYKREKIYTIKAFLGRDCELLLFNFIIILLKFGYYACVFLYGNPGLFPISKWTLLVTLTSGCRCALRSEMVARCIQKNRHTLPCSNPVFVLHTKIIYFSLVFRQKTAHFKANVNGTSLLAWFCVKVRRCSTEKGKNKTILWKFFNQPRQLLYSK